MTLLVFIYVQGIDMNIERLSMPCSNKHNLHLKNIFSGRTNSKEKSTLKSKKKSMARCRCKYNALDNLIFSCLSLSCFLLMLLTEGCIFLLASLESSQFLVESTLMNFFFILSSYLVYCLQVVHIAFTYLLLTLIYFHLECKILVKIPE